MLKQVVCLTALALLTNSATALDIHASGRLSISEDISQSIDFENAKCGFVRDSSVGTALICKIPVEAEAKNAVLGTAEYRIFAKELDRTGNNFMLYNLHRQNLEISSNTITAKFDWQTIENMIYNSETPRMTSDRMRSKFENLKKILLNSDSELLEKNEPFILTTQKQMFAGLFTIAQDTMKTSKQLKNIKLIRYWRVDFGSDFSKKTLMEACKSEDGKTDHGCQQLKAVGLN